MFSIIIYYINSAQNVSNTMLRIRTAVITFVLIVGWNVNLSSPEQR